MKTLNLGILAHVDAGKTSLTERLLFDAGVLGEIGSVDRGSTRTDSTDLERRRGITIRSAVVSFPIADVKINLIDTPGHADFIAEVERAIRVLDGAVLVVSAVEGVQAQTRILWRTLARLGIPALVFVNKIDRMGARCDEVLDELGPDAVALNSVRDAGTKEAFTVPEPVGWMGDLLAEQTRNSSVYPVFFGSAITGAGLGELAEGIRTLLPATENDGSGPLSGLVFKIERGHAGEKIAYARLFSGSIGARDQLTGHGKVTSVRDGDAPVDRVTAGNIARIRGLKDVRIGDWLGTRGDLDGDPFFSPPALETVVTAKNPADDATLHIGLERLAEEDPFIGVRYDGETTVRLYGEVQKEVLGTWLAEEFGVDAVFSPTRTIYLEKPIGTGEAAEVIHRREHNDFFATIGLRVEPGPEGSGIRYGLEVELGSLPAAFHTAIEETVHRSLRQGRYGWEVTDCVVTLTRSGFAAPVSTAADFRGLTPLVLAAALEKAGTQVYEPIHEFELEVPPDTIGAVLGKLAELGAVPRTVSPDSGRVDGTIQAGRVRELDRVLPKLTRGAGVLASRSGGFRPVAGKPPVRARTDGNPFDRTEYLRNRALG